MNLNNLARSINNANKEKGFDAAKENLGQTLMLIVSELSEALEADRTKKFANLDNFDLLRALEPEETFCQDFELCVKNTFQDEITDVLLRTLDLAGALHIDLDRHVELKMKYNSNREYKHGKKY